MLMKDDIIPNQKDIIELYESVDWDHSHYPESEAKQ